MYARHKFCRLTGTRMEAELLVELLMCLTILLQSIPDSLDGVRDCHRRVGGLPKKAALYFCREGCSMFFCTERAVHVSVDCYDPVCAWHLELKVCIVWYRVESGECGSFEQCMIATHY